MPKDKQTWTNKEVDQVIKLAIQPYKEVIKILAIVMIMFAIMAFVVLLLYFYF